MDRPAEEGNVLCGNYGIHLSESFLQIRSRACLKNHSYDLYSPGHDTDDSSRIWSMQPAISCPLGTSPKLGINSPYHALQGTNCEIHLTQSIFQTRSGAI